MNPPMQPLLFAADGVLRFQENKVVSALYDFAESRGFGLNEIAARSDFTAADRTQFAQLLGYSLCGFHELPYVSDADALAASAAARELGAIVGGCRDDGCPLHSQGEREP